MHCSIFPTRYTQGWNQFHTAFLTSSGALMIEEDAIHSKEIVGFSEIHHNPVGIEFCCPCKKILKCYCMKAWLIDRSDTHKSLSHAG